MLLPADLPPPVPYVSPAPAHTVKLPFVVAEKTSEKKISKEHEAFNKAVKTFEESLAKLPANHKAEVAKLHQEVDAWADKERSNGKKADKLATFVGKVMTYLHQRLLVIEKNDPQLTRLKDEHRQLQKLFLEGDKVINAYLAWVKNKKDPIDEPETAKPSKG